MLRFYAMFVMLFYYDVCLAVLQIVRNDFKKLSGFRLLENPDALRLPP